MTAVPNTRYERKLLPTGFRLAEMMSLVRRHPAGFRCAYPERVVNNIYFDSPSLACYHEHVNGAANRVKLRVRWYGESETYLDKPALEQKIKRGTVSGKVVHALPPMTLDGAPLQAALDDVFNRTALPELTRLRLRPLEPCLYSRYRRQYYVSGDGRFRLTIDFGLQFARVGKSSPAPRALMSGGPPVIVELKYRPQDAGPAGAITNAFPFRVKRCSKYVLGTECSARS